MAFFAKPLYDQYVQDGTTKRNYPVNVDLVTQITKTICGDLHGIRFERCNVSWYYNDQKLRNRDFDNLLANFSDAPILAELNTSSDADYEAERRKVWLAAWTATAAAGNTIKSSTCTVYADAALKAYDEKFNLAKK